MTNTDKVPVKMHADELDIGVDLVTRLLSQQFPKWSNLPIERVVSSGTNNAVFKLGDSMAVRLPRIPNAVKHIDTARTWLSKLAPHLPVAVPMPLGLGEPSEGYPWPWTIYTWLDGVNPKEGQVTELFAKDLAGFIAAMRNIDTTDAPKARRGAPLHVQDPRARQALKDLTGIIDTKTATKIWDKCLQAPPWDKEPVWVHGDLMPANLLASNNRLSGVCDFEGVGIGDPACDLIPAWNLFPTTVRGAFKAAANVDDATWERGKGWAFSMALIQLPYYKDTNPVMADNARYVIGEVLATGIYEVRSRTA